VLVIRPYRPSDRERVREIAYATGYMGEPPDWYWRDQESFAEIWTAWYTDHEPESSFVAEQDHEVVGFLFGCLDSAVAPSPRSAVTAQLLKRSLWLRPGTAGFFWRAIADTLRNPNLPSGELLDPRWPSHLHINLLPEARGKGAGRGLMEAWIGRLRRLGSPGCHLGTLAENTRAIEFFRAMGFTTYGAPLLVPGLRRREGGRMHQQLMVRDLAHPRAATASA
jgi:ribosomal protein S18 acetylase RimI-like enzyme